MSIEIPEVEAAEQVQTPSTVPTVSDNSLKRFDEAVEALEQAALVYKCESDEDYEAGGKAVERIRKLDGLFESTFKPIKDWWSERLSEARGEESKRRGKLELAKKTIGSVMLTYKARKQKEAEELRKREEAEAKRRAEDELLAQAEATGDIAVLDEPLVIAPTYTRAAVPKLKSTGGGKAVTTVKQLCVVGEKKYKSIREAAEKAGRILSDDDWKAAQVIDGDDLDDLILAVACSRIAFEMEAPPEVKAWAKARASRRATSDFLEAVPKNLRSAASKNEAMFNVGGVQIAYKERLG